MILSRVVGDVVNTQMNEHLRGNRLLLCEPVDLDGNASGNEFLALDLDVFVKTNFEEIRTGISVTANWTAIALEHPGDISIAQALSVWRP